MDEDWFLPAGHRIGLAVMSSNVWWAVPDDQRATNTLYSMKGARSALILPIVGGKEALKTALPSSEEVIYEEEVMLADFVSLLAQVLAEMSPTLTASTTPPSEKTTPPTAIDFVVPNRDEFFSTFGENSDVHVSNFILETPIDALTSPLLFLL